ncbi:hypothetical protein BDY21DRAFT_171563 [Lineolata rhizophorae]|uniref:Uncharacterized protein n=1 Tax=Lineolata rhizophorae TaxID=578093 RepID=A0A6A6P9Z4_9PEZI|nr:hypothetical protein BDY21DRAFT_171563 [Lineolata rhizophorae]
MLQPTRPRTYAYFPWRNSASLCLNSSYCFLTYWSVVLGRETLGGMIGSVDGRGRWLASGARLTLSGPGQEGLVGSRCGLIFSTLRLSPKLPLGGSNEYDRATLGWTRLDGPGNIASLTNKQGVLLMLAGCFA